MEERIADSYGGHTARRPAPGEHRSADRPRRCCQFFEGSGILPERAVVRVTVEQLGEARLAGAQVENIDKPLRVAVQQRTQKSTVNDAEDSSVGAYAQGEGENRNRRESRRLHQHAARVAK